MSAWVRVAVACFPLLHALTAHADSPAALFILDASNSMWGKVEGRSKIEIAREVLRNAMGSLPSEVKVGLETYGHRSEADCADIEMLAPLGADRQAIVTAVDRLKPKGKTPITESLRRAAAELRQHEGSASVILVSDGKETCEGDPCVAAREAVASGVRLRIHVIGFDVTAEEAAQLQCVAKEGRGKYFPAANAEELTNALQEVEKEVVAPKTILFEDDFNRSTLGEIYEITGGDGNKFALERNRLRLKASSAARRALLLMPIPGDFLATVKLEMHVTEVDEPGLGYWWKDGSFVQIGFAGTGDGALKLIFRKEIGSERAETDARGELGGRKLTPERSTDPQTWYLQLERVGSTWTGRASADGQRWRDIGSHTIARREPGRLGLEVGSTGTSENPADFDDLVVGALGGTPAIAAAPAKP
ncbi:MAG: VWA domain-containing protein, partial [Candidatus Binatia bacterium]